MATVIKRLGTRAKAGMIHHDDRPSTFEHADAIAGERLDRRRNYAIIDGKVCVLAQWSSPCSGCYESAFEYPNANDRGMGCPECGHTGSVRNAHWVPWYRGMDRD